MAPARWAPAASPMTCSSSTGIRLRSTERDRFAANHDCHDASGLGLSPTGSSEGLELKTRLTPGSATSPHYSVIVNPDGKLLRGDAHRRSRAHPRATGRSRRDFSALEAV